MTNQTNGQVDERGRHTKKFKLFALLLGLLAITALSLDAYARGRMYHPGLGRFMQRDVLGYVDGMSLYQYTRSNPIVATDPIGSCQKSEKGCYCCCCVEDLTIGNVRRIPQEDQSLPLHIGHSFDVTAKLRYKEWKGNFAGCKVEWWEWTDLPAFKGLQANKWNDMYALFPQSPTFDPVTKNRKHPCPGLEPVTINDRPAGPMGHQSANQTRELHFAIRVKSAAGCPCDKKEMLVYAVQRLAFNNTGLGATKQEFQVLAAPGKGGLPK